MLFIIGPLLVHLFAAIFQMSASSYYHAFLCESKERFIFLQCMDFCGICLMICGSTTSPFYYGFMCEENWFWGKVYLGQVWTFCIIALICTLCLDSKWVNAIAYIIAGYSTVPGIWHLAYYTSEESLRIFVIWPWLVGGTTYAVGAIFYALKFPERYFPRTFDIWLQSHTIFHLMIFAAASLHIWGSFRVFHERQLFPCPETGVVVTEPDHFT